MKDTKISKEGFEINDNATQKRKTLFFDPGNGTSVLVVPEVMKKLGISLISVNSHIDGRFPGRPSEPTAINLERTLNIARQMEFTYGAALDGDADRLILIDEKGNFIIGDKVCALGAMLLLQQKKGAVVTTVATSNVLRDVALENGGKIIYTKVGAPYLVEKVVNENAVFGGEEVGGLINPAFSLAKDGPYWTAKIIELLEQKGQLSKIISNLPEYFSEKMKVHCPHQKKHGVIEKMKSILANASTELIELDGVRGELSESEWVIVRASGTEEYIRIFAEAKSQEKAHKIAIQYMKEVERCL